MSNATVISNFLNACRTEDQLNSSKPLERINDHAEKEAKNSDCGNDFGRDALSVLSK